jgi:hypothetical protein
VYTALLEHTCVHNGVLCMADLAAARIFDGI